MKRLLFKFHNSFSVVSFSRKTNYKVDSYKAIRNIISVLDLTTSRMLDQILVPMVSSELC